MLKPTSITLSVDTPTRLYEVKYDSCGSGITVTVETELDNGNLATEFFSIKETDIKEKISGTKDLENWFYGTFAYQYADLHKNDEEPGCVRASILFDLGNYKVATEKTKEETHKETKYSINPGTMNESVQFYVCMNNDPSNIYKFTSYDNAEQWANEKLYQEEYAPIYSDERSYTIFTVDPDDKAEQYNNDKSSILDGTIEPENIFFYDDSFGNRAIYHFTKDQINNLLKKKK